MGETMQRTAERVRMGGDDLRRTAAQPARPAPLPSAARLAADRHSRRVRRLKILLPATAVVFALGIGVAAWVQARLQGALDVKTVLFSKDGLTMVEPHLSGHAEGRAYDITAAKAVQSIRDPKIISLEGIDGRIEMADGTWTKIEARRGLYDGTHEHLTLEDQVITTTSTGWRATGEHADADLATGRLVADRRVRITGKTGWIEADTVVVGDGGHHMVFTGNVQMQFLPGDGTPAAPDSPPAAR